MPRREKLQEFVTWCGKHITTPDVPKNYPEPKKLVTEDFIKAD